MQSKDALHATSNSLRFRTTWQNGITRKSHFHFKCCISALPEFNQLLDFFSLFDSRVIVTLVYDSLNLVINAFISGLLGPWFRINEVESAAEVALCCTHSAPVRCLLDFLFRKRWGGKQSIVWFLTFSVTLLAKIIVIGSSVSRLCQVKGRTFFRRSVVTFCVSRRRRKMYCGHARLCVCLSVCPRPYAHTTARSRM